MEGARAILEAKKKFKISDRLASGSEFAFENNGMFYYMMLCTALLILV
jgi:hypothetical protein